MDQRDQAEGWYVPVHGHVMTDGKKVDGVEVMLYKDNVALGKVPVSKKGTFELQLDIDQMFTVMISKPGFQNKMIYVDTSLPKDLVEYPDYECFVTLAPPNAQNIETFYTDFPSAIIRWNADMASAAENFVRDKLDKGPFVGIHLRNGIDWVSVTRLGDF